ncbi:CPBP family intramembrane glutamic endopeptidase [Ornithinibacillus halophilus]|uniref:CAAX protease self-immunity n=1 Tax=Ornithinibacillus halophilus TaxID=930117 RepID=A0A1M5CIW0_9BACI|nr:CPBP family intramembrane glutamic endopeptidase [Ornithinibacillus halophilus]SHF54626.1 CAAX protease self-immunity [Ornithinibacillus halophilus]
MRLHSIFIIISTLITCTILAFIEHGMENNYVIKTILKIVLFALNIGTYVLLFKNFKVKELISIKKLSKKEWRRIFLLGLSSAIIVLIAFLITKPFLDLNSIKQDLNNRLGITASTFIFVGLYISFGNSFIEEVFFRGFIFFNLPRKWGYLYSPLLFSTYHIPMIMLWFEPLIIGICFIGLLLIGIIFQKVNEKNGTIWSSWIIHIFADIMIIIIGCFIFYT